MSNNLIYLFLLLSCSWGFAQEQESFEKLSSDPHWLKLLHYSSPLIGKARSDVTSKDFFLSEDGRSNPFQELKATIKAIHESETSYCKFPSRRIWLEGKGLSFPKRECKDFLEWTRGNSIKSVSLIFASGYLGNPASFFGHPLLKLNFKDERSPHDFLDTAINYGAFTPPNVDPFSYAISGIFGGYNAGFTSADFFFHANNYSELELRDMWEYELQLSEDQVRELVAHLWDMKGATISYLFFSDNCAYRMGEVLELVTNKEFVSEHSPYAIPAALFHKLYEYSLVTDLKLLKSRQSRMTEKVLSLSSHESRSLHRIVDDPSYINSARFISEPKDSRSKILEATIDYYSYRLVTEKDDEVLKESRKQLLKQRLALPPKTFAWNEIPLTPPHKSQRPILTQIGFVQSENFGRTGTFRFRPVYYDLVSPDSGRPPRSSLSVLDFELNANEERLWLKNFNLISIETLNLSRTHLKNDGGFAWRFKVGADQVNLSCNTCTVPKLEVGGGKAWELTDKIVLFGMIDPRVQSHFEGSGILSVTPSISTLLTFSNDFRLSASAGKRYQIDVGHIPENIFNVEGRIGSDRTWDVRVTFQQHVDRRYGFATGFYW